MDVVRRKLILDTIGTKRVKEQWKMFQLWGGGGGGCAARFSKS